MTGNTAARRLGMAEAEYAAKVSAGGKWCSGHKAWHLASAFGPNRARTDGLNTYCRAWTRRAIGKVGPRDGQPRVLLSGQVFFYAEKEPFEVSGQSIRSGLEYDAATDKVKCHECGEWFRGLGTHVYKAHGLTAREYKLQHGLALNSALVAEGVRERLTQRAHLYAPAHLARLRRNQHTAVQASTEARAQHGANHAEIVNRHRTCELQLLTKIKQVAAAVGHTPSVRELREYGIAAGAVERRFGSFTAAARRAGLVPNDNTPKFPPELLVSLLHGFAARHGRSPSRSDCRRGLLPSAHIFTQRFGSWKGALAKAGLRQKTSAPGRWSHA